MGSTQTKEEMTVSSTLTKEEVENNMLTKEEKLVLAAGGGDASEVDALIKAKPDIDHQNNGAGKWKGKVAALYIASRNGHQSVVEKLLEAKANVNAQTEQKWTALHIASDHGHQSIVEKLLDAKANIDAQGGNANWTPLNLASRWGKSAVAEVLLTRKANPYILNVDGHSPLSSASLEGHGAVVDVLLTHKVALNLKYKDRTPLEWASAKGHAVVVEKLLAHIVPTNEERDQLVELAGSNNHTALAETLKAKKKTSEELRPPPQSSPSASNEESDEDEIVEADDDDISDFFRYHQHQSIPYQDLTVAGVSSHVTAEFKQLCKEKTWNSLGQLIHNYDQHASYSPCLQDPQLSKWLSDLSEQTYPASINNESIRVGKRLGGGKDGEVYMAEWTITKNSKQKILVAYKKLAAPESDAVRSEFKTWKMIPHHENIARLYGAVRDGDGKNGPITGLVAELHTSGSLLDKLKSSRVEFSDRMILKVLLGVAKGLQHLHTRNIVHRDLFARNILLNKKLKPIITDFGLSRNGPYELQRLVTPVGTAPEVLKTHTFTFESDVYSLGVLVWEMTNPGKPVPGNNFTFEGMTEANKIAVKCCNVDPNRRPTVKQVIELCEEGIRRLSVIVDPDVDIETLLKRLNIPKAEKIAEEMRKKSLTAEILTTLPFPRFERECLKLKMATGHIFALANALGITVK